jgi:subtilisin family serine protease
VDKTIYADGMQERILTVGNDKLRFIRRPELGYVIKVKNNTASIETLSGMLKHVRAVDISPIRGLGRKGISIVHSKRPAGENESTIGMLKAHSRIQYAAPLFSSNGEMIAVIPEIVIRVKPDTQIEQIQTVCQTVGCKIKKRMEFTTQEYLLEVLGPDADAVFSAVEQLNEVSFVEWACPNTASRLRLAGEATFSRGRVHAQDSKEGAAGASATSCVFPNDEYFSEQWHLNNTGQICLYGTGGTPNADMNAPEAWQITTGDPNIIVAVVDSGVDTNHPDLINNLVPGYDFYDNDDLPDPALDHSLNAHGTACAGLIAAQGNNSIGVSGVTWNCKIMPIRISRTDSQGQEHFITDSDKATAFRWAASHGADVLSNSWGSRSPEPIILSATIDITEPGGIGRGGKGCIVFFSSHNDGGPVLWPAKYPEVVAVGATDHHDVRWHYSNYGPELDIVAPSGGREVADIPGGFQCTTDISGPDGVNNRGMPDIYGPMVNLDMDYRYFGGTSGACPVAAGVAALILSVEPNLTNEEVRRFLEHSAKDLGDPGWDEYYGHGRVDARAAVELAMAARADLNDDCFVNLRDFAKLAQFWMQDEASVDIYPPPEGDGIIDVWDVITMGEYWLREIPRVGLVAHWELDETDGDIVYDSAGDNDATVYNGEWTDGKIEGALDFNGWTTYMDCGDSEVLGPEKMTLAMWLWPEHMGGMRYVLSRANEDTDVMDYMLMRQREGELELAVGQICQWPAGCLGQLWPESSP